MQVTKQCNKNKPIYLMWREAGLNTGSVAVLSQMGLAEQGLSLPHCKRLLAMHTMHVMDPWSSEPPRFGGRNAEEMRIGASSKDVSVERAHRSHKRRLRALT